MTSMGGKPVSGSDEEIETKGQGDGKTPDLEGTPVQGGGDTRVQGGGDTRVQGGGDTRDA